MTHLLDFFNSTKMIKVSGLPSREDHVVVVVPVEVDGGLYASWLATAATQYTFRQGPQYVDSYANSNGHSARIARLTTDLDPWWVAGINPSTEDTQNRVVFVNDIISLHDDGGAIVIGTFSSTRNQPASGLYSMNFYNADGSLAFNVPKKNKALYGGFFAKISFDGVWQWCKQIWDDGFNSGVDSGAKCLKGSLLPDGSFAVIGSATLVANNVSTPTPSRLFFDNVTSFTNIITTLGANRIRYDFVGIYDDAGDLIAAQVDSPEADNGSPTQTWLHVPAQGTDHQILTADYAQGVYTWAGGASPYASDAGLFHTASRYYAGGAGQDILLDYGNTNLYLPYVRESSTSATGFVAARNASGVDWAGTLVEPNLGGTDFNSNAFSDVWTFPDGGCIALGKATFEAVDDQNAQLQRYPSAIAPVTIDANGKPYIVAVRYAANGDVVWSRRIVEYSIQVSVGTEGLPIFTANLYNDEANNEMTFLLGTGNTTAWSVIDGAGGLHAVDATGAYNKNFLVSIDKDTGAVTRTARVIETGIAGYAYAMTVNNLTGKTYVMTHFGGSAPIDLFPTSAATYEKDIGASTQNSVLIEVTPTASPADPLTDPYTPTRVTELTLSGATNHITRAVRPIITTTSYSKAEQYYDFYARRVALASGTVEDPAATLAFIAFMVENDMWTMLSSAFVPWAGFIKDGGGLVSRWFNLHGPDVYATLTARPVWVAADAAFNNLPSIAFDGTNDALAAVNQSEVRWHDIFLRRDEFEAYAVFNADVINTNTNGANDALIQVGQAGLELNSVPRMQIFSNDGTVDVAASVITTGATYLAHGRHEGGQIISSIDDGVETSSASGNVTPANLGVLTLGANGGAFFDGRLSLLPTFRRTLSPDQRTALFAYIKDLYAIA